MLVNVGGTHRLVAELEGDHADVGASTPMPSSCAALGRLEHARASPRADAYGRSNGGGFPGDLGSSTVHNLSASPPRPSRTVASWVTFVS